MAQLTLPEELTRRLSELADQEHRPVAEVIKTLLDGYSPSSRSQTSQTDALLSLAGMFDMGPTDFATEVKEMRRQHDQSLATDHSLKIQNG
jgi:hypothetical protein